MADPIILRSAPSQQGAASPTIGLTSDPSAALLIGPAGMIGSVPKGDLGSIPPGWRLATDEEATAARRKQELSTPLHTLGAAAAGFARGAIPFGLTDVAITGVADAADALGADGVGESVRETMRDYRKFSPIASTAGEAAGVFYGVGKFTKAAKAAGELSMLSRVGGAPMRGLLGVGEAVEQGAKLIPGASRLGIPFIARNAAEGALFGTGLAVTEAALGDSELNGELLASALGEVGNGAAVGGILGAGMFGLGKGLVLGARAGSALLAKGVGTLEPYAIEGIAGTHYGWKPAGLGKAVAEAFPGAASLVSGKSAEATRAFIRDPSKIAYAQHADELRLLHGTEAGAALKELHATAEDAQNYLRRGLKREAVATIMTDVDPTLVRAEVIGRRNEVLGTLIREAGIVEVPTVADLMSQGMKRAEASAIRSAAKAEAKDALATARGIYGKKGVTRLRDAIDYLKAKDLGDDAAGHFINGGDDIKRYFDTNARAVHGGRAKLPEQEAKLFNLLRGVADDYRTFLEDTKMWKAGGTLQKEVNAAWSSLIDVEKRGEFFKQFMRTIPGDYGKVRYEVDTDKVLAAFRGVTNPDTSTAMQALREWTGEARNTAKTFQKYADLTPELKARIGKMDELLPKLEGHVEEAAKASAQLEQWKGLTGGNSSLLAGLVGGGVAMGSPLAMGAAALAPLMNPQRTLAQFAAVANIIGKTKAKLAGRVGPALTKGAFNIVRLGTVSEHARERKQYERNAESVRARAANPIPAYEALEESVRPVADGIPKTTAGLFAHADRASAYLVSKLPKDQSLGPGGKPVPAPQSKVVEFNRIARAVQRGPAQALDEIARGYLTPETAKAFSATGPRAFAELQKTVFGKMLDLEAKGKALPYATRVNFALTLGMPEPTMAASMITAWQAFYAMPESKPPAHAPRAKRDSRGAVNLQTASEQLARDTATA